MATIWQLFKAVFTGKAITTASMRETWGANDPSFTRINYQNLVKHGWEKNELIFACLQKTANASAQVHLQVLDEGGVEIEDHPLTRLIKHPNPFMNEFDLWGAILVTRKLAGVSYWEKEFDNAGNIIALWPLRPDWMKPVPASRIELAYYEYRPPGMPAVRLEADEVLVFKMWHPLGLFSRWSPVAVAARVGDTDNEITKYIKLFFEKGGTPPGLLKTKQRLDEKQVESLRARWRARYGGTDSWIDPAVLDSDAEYQRIGLSFGELASETLDSRNESRICAALDVPPIIVGANVGLQRSTFSNYEEARISWWQDSLIPGFEDLLDAFTNQMPSQMVDNVKVSWNFSDVPAIKALGEARWEPGVAAAQAGLITRNEFRELVNLPKTEDGDIYLVDPTQRAPGPTVMGSGSTPAETKAEAAFSLDDLRGRGDLMKLVLEDQFERDVQAALRREMHIALTDYLTSDEV